MRNTDLCLFPLTFPILFIFQRVRTLQKWFKSGKMGLRTLPTTLPFPIIFQRLQTTARFLSSGRHSFNSSERIEKCSEDHLDHLWPAKIQSTTGSVRTAGRSLDMNA